MDLANAQVKQKDAAIESAKAELDVMEAKIKAAIAKRNSDKAYLVFRQAQARRFEELAKSSSIDARTVDEQMDRLEAARESVNASEEAVNSARAQKISAAAKIKQADADLEESKRQVEVTQAELDRAKVMVGFATIKAPFDGVIVDRDRHANVGAIVQKSESGTVTPLLTIQRNDIVRVVMQVPDNYQAFVTPDTEAVFETSAYPGVKIHGKVTRYPDTLVNASHDRTLRVEVDLWNSDEDYYKKMADEKFTSQLRKGMPRRSQTRLSNPAGVQGRTGSQREVGRRAAAPATGHVRRHDVGAEEVRQCPPAAEFVHCQPGRSDLHLPRAKWQGSLAAG